MDMKRKWIRLLSVFYPKILTEKCSQHPTTGQLEYSLNLNGKAIGSTQGGNMPEWWAPPSAETHLDLMLEYDTLQSSALGAIPFRKSQIFLVMYCRKGYLVMNYVPERNESGNIPPALTGWGIFTRNQESRSLTDSAIAAFRKVLRVEIEKYHFRPLDESYNPELGCWNQIVLLKEPFEDCIRSSFGLSNSKPPLQLDYPVGRAKSLSLTEVKAAKLQQPTQHLLTRMPDLYPAM